MNKLTSKVLWSIPILFVIGGLLHFAYQMTGNCAAIGIIAPVNESIFEHLKLSFYPILIWCIIQLIIGRNKDKYFSDRCKVIVSAFVSCLMSMLVIIGFFYSYTQMFGVDIAILDVFSLLLGIAIGQFAGLHIYNHIKCNKTIAIASLIGIILIIIMFTIWTFNTPHIPFFRDPQTFLYGIQNA